MGVATARSVEWSELREELMRSRGMLKVATALGLAVQPPRGSSGGSFPCPACNAPKRHTKTRDKRDAAGVRSDGQGWRCYQCDASGDVLDLVAYDRLGKSLPDLGDAGKDEVRDWCMRELGINSAAPRSRTMPRPAAPPKPVIVEPPKYPPAAEVAELWAAGARVDTDPAVAAWLRDDRALDPTAIADMDLARVLQPNAFPLPRWAGFGGDNGKPWRSWSSVGLRLVVPLYDANGCMRSMLFRRSFETPETWPPKSMAANGFERSALIMVCPLGRQLLALGALPEWWPQAAELRVVITEGETDFITWTTRWSAEHAPAVIGIESGSWTDELAARIPNGSVIVVATDADKQGDVYAARIIETLAERMRAGQMKVERWKP